MSVVVNSPAYIVKTYQKEAIEKIRGDLSRVCDKNVTPDGLISNRAAAWNLEFITSCSTDDETAGDTLFPLIVRNRRLKDLQKTAEAVVLIFQEQNFTVSEAMLFLKHLESLILASPVNY